MRGGRAGRPARVRADTGAPDDGRPGFSSCLPGTPQGFAGALGGRRHRNEDSPGGSAGCSFATAWVTAPLAGEGLTMQRADAWDRLAECSFDLLVIGAGIVGSRVAYE